MLPIDDAPRRKTRTFADIYNRWQSERLKADPNAREVFVVPDRTLSWYKGFYLSLYEVMRGLHIGYGGLLRALDSEGITVVQFPVGSKNYCFISPQDLPRLKAVYGSKTAQERRSRNWRSTYPPLRCACKFCGKRGRQHRAGTLESGNQLVRCCHCNRRYSLQVYPNISPPPIQTTCPHCAATDKQWRNQVLPGGLRKVICGHCRRYHTIQNPDPPKPTEQEIQKLTYTPQFEQIDW